MTVTPNTRNSLILRLRDRNDVESWQEFVELYEPVVYRAAIRRGVQHADALELVQRVLLAVARAVDRFQPDSRRAKFRTWLYRITHNEFCKEFGKKRATGSGDTAVLSLLEQQPEPRDDEFGIEYRRAVFRWAADRVRPTFKDSTWRAFWLTSVDGCSSVEAAKETGLSVGAVYVARSRVMARLQQQAATYEEEQS